MQKIVFVAHPISGDVTGNLNKIKNIIRNINILRDEYIPFVPYFSDCCALNDDNAYERERGIKNTEFIFRKNIIDEVWLYGDFISKGMKAEILLAYELNIPIVSQSLMVTNKAIRNIINGRS